MYEIININSQLPKDIIFSAEMNYEKEDCELTLKIKNERSEDIEYGVGGSAIFCPCFSEDNTSVLVPQDFEIDDSYRVDILELSTPMKNFGIKSNTEISENFRVDRLEKDIKDDNIVFISTYYFPAYILTSNHTGEVMLELEKINKTD